MSDQQSSQKSFRQTTLDFQQSTSGNENQHETPSRYKRSKDDMIKSPPLTLESMKNEVSDIKTAMAESEDRIVQKLTHHLTGAFNAANTKMLNGLETKIDSVMSAVDEDRRTTQRISTNVDRLIVSSNDMQAKINQLEQEKFNNSMEISGLSLNYFAPNVSLRKLTHDIFMSYNIQFNIDGLVRVYAREIKVNNEVRKLLVITFANYDEKLHVMKLKRQNEKEKPVKIFFSHVLTQQNRSLFMRARQVAKSLNIKQVYVAYGRIYMKNDEDRRGSLIKSHEDIDVIENSKRLPLHNQPPVPLSQQNNNSPPHNSQSTQ